ncbi:MAG: HAD family hydrolase, partial [Burkholderiaceae bacterium]
MQPTTPNAPIKAVLFDLDDTLWPILPVIQRAETVLHAWLAAHAPGVAQRFTIAELRQRRLALAATHPRFRYDLQALRRAGLAEAYDATGEAPATLDAAMAVFDAERNRVALYDDVRPALERIGRRFAIGAVTNGPADLAAIGIAPHFGAVVAAHAFGCGKPDPSIFLACCEALGVSPAETVHVGDDPLLDVRGAQEAGLRAVWIDRFDRVLPPGVAPDGVCATLDDLDDWLDTR